MLSEPYFSQFVPFGYQKNVLDLLYNHDYSKYTPEILLSGSVGSSKSILCAHAAISHCLRWPRARIAISRQALPDLRKTIYNEIIEHLENSLIEGIHYVASSSTCHIKFKNKSEIIAVTFGDKRYSKVKSLKLSGVIIEEGTDFDDEFYREGGGFVLLKGRLRRIPNVKENFLIVATNPDEPDHALYKYFIQGANEFASRYVFYSITSDNPHLDPVYIKQLQQDYSQLEADRYIRGLWISLFGKGVYSAYSTNNFIENEDYHINKLLPVRLSFDFNIALNKPMSAVFFQYNPSNDHFYFFNESVIEGANTEDILEDIWARGIVDRTVNKLIIHGDATGRARSTQSLQGNYDIIYEFFNNRRVNVEIEVPPSNPPIITRHRKVNAYCKNDLGQVRLFVYPKAKTMDEGMRLTKLKKGSAYIEDDSKPYQHITTAAGYGICSVLDEIETPAQRETQL